MTDFSRSRLQTGVKIVFVVVVALIAFAVGAVLLPPWWWSPAHPDDVTASTRASRFEQEVTSRVHTIRKGGEPWGFRVTQDQVNAWLATRLPKWIEHDASLRWPEGITAVQVRFGEGEIELGGRGSGPVWRARFAADLKDGACQLQPIGGGIGRVPIQGVILQGVAGMVPEGVLQENGTIAMPTELELVDGRRIQLVDFEFVDGALGVLLVTHPSGDTGQEAPRDASTGDDPPDDEER